MKSHRTPEIAPAELARRLEAGEPVRVLDIRAPQRLEAGRVEPVAEDRFHNVRGSEFVRISDPEGELGLDPADPVAVVCARGNDSKVIATLLGRRGYEAWSMRGGVLAWMRMSIPRDIEPPAGFDGLVQFDRIGKGALGYLLVAGGEALAVDPSRDWEAWSAAAETAGARIIGAADTHVHADYISGGPAMAAALGVPYYLHPADNAWPYDGTPGRLELEPLTDGTVIPVGGVPVTVRHTPGHTEGSVTFEAGDTEGGSVGFTGDFVFVDSVGRPDLAGKTDAWTGDLWRSLERVKAEWDAGLRVLPAHYVSESERNPDRTVDRPFGRLREENVSLRIEDEAAFRAWVAARISTPPEAYPHIKAINAGLATVGPDEADVLEAGRSECALA